MRETFKLILSAIAVVILTVSCNSAYKDVKVSSFNITELNVTGLRTVNGSAAVGVSNPAEQFSVSEIAASLKTFDGNPMFNVSSAGFEVAARCDSVYTVEFEASLPQNITPMWLLGNFRKLDPHTLLIDMSMKFTPRFGIGTTLSYKDVPLDKIDELK